MRPSLENCRHTLDKVARLEELGATERARIEVHLRRCPECSRAYNGLLEMERFSVPTPALPKVRQNDIYDRLVPVIHELTDTGAGTRRKWRPVYNWTLGGIGVLAAAAVVMLWLGPLSSPPDEVIADFAAAPTAHQEGYFPSDAMFRHGQIDRAEGRIFVNGSPLEPMNDSFPIEEGTQVALLDRSRVNFTMGSLIKVALVDETSFLVEEISGRRIGLRLNRGDLAIEYDGSTGRQLEVRTPSSVVMVKGTIFTVSVDDDGMTRVSVSRGKVEVRDQHSGQVVKVAAGYAVNQPGKEQVTELSPRQRVLAQEITGLEERLVTHSGRLVHFTGQQEDVNVEVEGQLIGHTPLSVRLPEGPLHYRLTKPGMRTIESRLTNEQVAETVAFSMVPQVDYVPMVVDGSAGRRSDRNSSRHLAVDSEQESRNFAVRAKAAMTAGDLKFAVTLLEKTVARVDGSALVEAISLLAECYSALGRYSDAANAFERVAALSPGTAVGQRARYEVGRLAMDRLGDFDRARAAFTTYVASPKRGPLQEDAYFSLCELYGREGARTRALSCFNNYLQNYPDGHRSPFGHLWRGVLRQEVDQDWNAAEVDLLSFITQKSHHPRAEEARYRIALGRYHQRDYAGALRMFDEYTREHPAGRYLIRLERLRQAILDRGDRPANNGLKTQQK